MHFAADNAGTDSAERPFIALERRHILGTGVTLCRTGSFLRRKWWLRNALMVATLRPPDHLSWLTQALPLPSARWALGILFFVAAAEKSRHRRRFVFVVLSYRVLPKTLSRVYGLTLPWLEAGVSLALLLDVAVRLAASLALTLLISFMIAILVNITRKRTELNCGCFGQGHRQRLGEKVVVRNAILILLSLVVILG